MPIPTKKLAVRPRTDEATHTARIASSKRTRSNAEQADSQDNEDKKSEASTTSETLKLNNTSSRVSARPPSGSKQALGTVKPTRHLSANISTSRSTSESSKTLNRPTPTSSMVTRSTGNAQSRIIAPSTKLKPESNTSRIRSTSTAHTAKPATNTTSRTKPTSTIPAPSRTVRSLKDTANNINSSQSKPSTAKQEPPNTPSRLDDELFQLKLLHFDSHHTLHNYRKSIRATITHKQSQLQTLETQVLDLENGNTQALSTNALAAWLDPLDPKTQQTQIQQLSTTIHDLDALTSDPSTLTPLQTFDTWLTTALATREARTSSSSSDLDLIFINSLPRTWTQSMLALKQTLTTILASLHELLMSTRPPDQDREDSTTKSGISVLLTRQHRFAETLLQEVEVALAVERGVMSEEVEWEKGEVRRAMAELGVDEQEGEERGGGNGGSGGVYQGVWAS